MLGRLGGIGKGISRQATISNLPSISGDAVGAFGAETANSVITKEATKKEGEK